MDRTAATIRGIAFVLVAGLAFASTGCLVAALGCAGAAAAAGGYVYTQGNNCQLYAASFDDTFAAARIALTDLGMPIQEEKKENGTGYLRSQTSDGESVRVSLEPQPSKFPADRPQTTVCVRVGVFGDHPASVRIFDQLAQHLTPATPRPTVAATAPATWTPAPSATPPASQPTSSEPPLLKPEPATAPGK
jgi:hypothetical protein